MQMALIIHAIPLGKPFAKAGVIRNVVGVDRAFRQNVVKTQDPGPPLGIQCKLARNDTGWKPMIRTELFFNPGPRGPDRLAAAPGGLGLPPVRLS